MNKIFHIKNIVKFLCTCILLSISIVQAYSQLIVIDLNGNELSMIDANRSLITDMGNGGISAGSVWMQTSWLSDQLVPVIGPDNSICRGSVDNLFCPIIMNIKRTIL